MKSHASYPCLQYIGVAYCVCIALLYLFY